MADNVVENCSHEGCTYVETQVCARSGGPTPCEFAVFAEVDEALQAIAVDPGQAATGIFHTGEELGLDELNDLMEAGYSRIIAILGDQDAGKTCLIMSLYLLAAAGDLDDHGLRFAGSLTLPGFESRVNNTRRWESGRRPDRMSLRTKLEEGRGAGFMHLDLAADRAHAKIRLLLSDLPGEWTRELIENERHADRLSFIRRADSILLLWDGATLTGDRRFIEVERATMLIDRLLKILSGSEKPNLLVVATRGDKLAMSAPPSLADIVAYARSNGFTANSHVICTFSEDEQTDCGAGIVDLLKAIIAVEQRAMWPAPKQRPSRLYGWQPIMEGHGSDGS